MLRLKDRQHPFEGFQYRQAQTGQFFMNWDFETVVTEIINHRRLNPRFNLPTDQETVRTELDHENAVRQMSIRGRENFVIQDAPGGTFDPKRMAPRSALQNVVGGVKKIASGKAVLSEWLGEGGEPVRGELANQRAATCAKCPQNKAGDWTAFFTEPAAEMIRRKLSLRHDLNLTTPDDDKLVVCGACLCPLKLKVHTPLKHIVAHMSAEVRSELDPGCWILTEENPSGT